MIKFSPTEGKKRAHDLKHCLPSHQLPGIFSYWTKKKVESRGKGAMDTSPYMPHPQSKEQGIGNLEELNGYMENN